MYSFLNEGVICVPTSYDGGLTVGKPQKHPC